MDSSVAPPVIPPRKSLSLHNRRASLPPLTKAKNHASANHVQLQPASPEVMSSLISSLSNIESPTRDHFENMPPMTGYSHSTPTSPSAFQSTFSPMDFSKSRSRNSGSPLIHMDSREYLHPLDAAATPPVVRTSKPPSGLTSSIARQTAAIGTSQAAVNYSWNSGMSYSELPEDQVSIGSPSIKPGNPPDTPSRRSSTSTKSWRSKGLIYMTSKERLSDKDSELRRASLGAVGSPEKPSVIGLGLQSSRKSSYEPLAFQRIISEESEGSRPLPRRSVVSAETSPSIGSHSPIVGAIEGSSAGRLIPLRDSSLRKTSRSSSGRTRKSHHSGHAESSRRTSLAPTDVDLPEDTIAEKHIANGERRRSNRSSRHSSAQIPPDPVLNGQISLPALGQSFADSLKFNGTFTPDQNKDDTDEESAPAPAVVQRKPRESTKRIPSGLSVSPAPTRRSVSGKSTIDTYPPEPVPVPSRRNSRLQKKRPESPKDATTPHRRTFSMPLGRNSESTPRPMTVFFDDRPSSADSIDDAVDSYLYSPRLSQKIQHPQTGRTISFSEVGDPDGFAVFCCVGMGLTRYITAFYDELAATLKLRLITPDRPGVGESEPYADGAGTPLGWPDDVYAICQARHITKFSLLAHSAGAIYALATALRMPQHIRGRIHLLAPWIPPSQMSVIGSQLDMPPAGAVPTSQRILRALPTPVLKVANSSFMSATSSSITSSLPKSPRRKRKSAAAAAKAAMLASSAADMPSGSPPGRTLNDLSPKGGRNKLSVPQTGDNPDRPPPPAILTTPSSRPTSSSAGGATGTYPPNSGTAPNLFTKERQLTYDDRLTHSIWTRATANANPAVDLLVCLERRQPIGFRYVDITRAVVIHHGSRDTRVPVDNVRWLGKTMRRCEVRVLEGEGHGLMASARVMGGVLMEIAREWEDWMEVVRGGRGGGGERSPAGRSPSGAASPSPTGLSPGGRDSGVRARRE